MDIAARRVFRVSLTTALALAGGYALALDMPYVAPLFGFMLSAAPKPPMGFKGLLGFVVLLCLMLSGGLLLVPVLLNYPATGLLLVSLGLFFSNYVALNLGKAQAGSLLTIGLALMPAAGLASFAIATALIEALAVGVAVAVLCQWLVYPLFPEDAVQPAPVPPSPRRSSWLALRATIIVFPSFLLGLSNPSAYLPLIMKSVSLGQQDSVTDARHAGRELLGSTFMGGFLAVLFWGLLSVWPSLWMFTLYMALFAMFIGVKLFGVSNSRYPPSFWSNVMITLLILLGPAVADSANGKDVYKAFAVRMSLFVAVTIYAGFAVVMLEHWRERQQRKRMRVPRGASAG